MPNTNDLLNRHCRHQTQALEAQEIISYLEAVPGWQQQNAHISRAFEFKNYYRTMAFVNAIAYLFHTEDHHPHMLVSFKRCVVTFSTHSVNGGQGGLSENDFICAAKVDAVYLQGVEQT
jgi:4a-hydroxytetrahydrobiopterin dehydratase